jgi:hypothetical protein
VGELKGTEMQGAVDTLSDIDLTNKKLVSNNPADWIVPVTMRQYDTVIDWWDALASNADGLAEIPKQKQDLLLWLANDYEQLQSEAFQGQSTVPHQAKIRSVLRQICQNGLTTAQTARLVRTSQQQVMAELYCNRPLDSDGINARLEAEQAIRDGHTMPDVMRLTGLNRDQLETLVAMLGLHPVAATRSHTSNIRERAIQLRLQGLTNPEVAQALSQEGATVKPATISKWWERHHKQEGNN